MHLNHPFSKLGLASAVFSGVVTSNMPGAVIDLFYNSPQSVEKTTLGLKSVESTAVLEGNLFPSRRIVLGYGTQQATVSDGMLSYEVTAHPSATPLSNTHGYLNLEYSSDQPVNLLGRGDTAFVVRFNSFHAEYPYVLNFYVSNFYTLNRDSYPLRLTQSGEVIIPFSVFGSVDLTAVTFLGVDAARMAVGTSFVISSITTIPEPSGASLLLVSIMGTSRRRRFSGQNS
jgi:hypothetical protein